MCRSQTLQPTADVKSVQHAEQLQKSLIGAGGTVGGGGGRWLPKSMWRQWNHAKLGRQRRPKKMSMHRACSAGRDSPGY